MKWKEKETECRLMECGIDIHCEFGIFGQTTVFSMQFQKHVMIAVILANSSNKNADVFQTVIPFFCESKGTPQKIIEMLVHMGVSCSLSSCCTLVKKLANDGKVSRTGCQPMAKVQEGQG